MGKKILASLVVIVAVLALNVGTQAGAAKQTEAEITCVAGGNTVIDWLPGQTSFTIDFFFEGTTRYFHVVGIMKGGGKYTMPTPPGAVTWRADVAGELHSGTCA